MRRSSLILLMFLVSLVAACGVAPVIAPAPAETGVHLTDAEAASCRDAFRVVNGYAAEMVLFGYREGATEPHAWSQYADERVRSFGDAYNAAVANCPLNG